MRMPFLTIPGLLFLCALTIMPQAAFSQYWEGNQGNNGRQDRTSQERNYRPPVNNSELGGILNGAGFEITDYSNYNERNSKNMMRRYPRLALHQPTYKGVYGGRERGEFVLVSRKFSYNIWVENIGVSNRSGGVERLPYVLLNAYAANPGRHVILIAERGAYDWLREAVQDSRWKAFSNVRGKRVDVMTRGEFEDWLLRSFQ